MCSSVKGNERSSVFFDHMARASSLSYISEISQMLKALAVCADMHMHKLTHAHILLGGCHGHTNVHVNKSSA